MKLLFSRGMFALSLAFAASAVIDAVSAADFEGRPLNGRDLLRDRDDMNMNMNMDMDMPSFKAYDSGSIKSLLVSYRDEAGHRNVLAHTRAMISEGRAIKEASNIAFSKQHRVSGKASKARRARGLQDDRDDLAFDSAKGISIVTVDTATENFDDEVTALENIEGVSSVEENLPVHIFSTDMEHEQNLRGVKAADHISEIQDAMKAAADALPVPEDKIDYSPSHEGRGRRLAEEVPYGINMVNASWVWDQDQSPAMVDPIKICVVDTGYDPSHQDLPNEADHNVIGHVGEDDSGPNMGQWNMDGHGHGTHCAGTIGAIGDNGVGVTSVNPDPSKFQFIIGKGLSDSGSGTSATVLSAVEQCVSKGAKVISMSLGGGGFSDATNDSFKEHYDDGVLIIAAAGNSGNSAYSYPASYPVVMSVGSVTSTRVRSGFSQYNDQVEIAAPGSQVLSTLPGNKYASWSGTSMATPHVAGVAALLWSHFPDCTNNQIRNAMIHSAADPPTDSDGWTGEYGWGIVNAGNAYELLSTGCETAGGLATPLNGQHLSDIAYGGKDQKNVGCTLDEHCDQSNSCDVGTSECVPPPSPPCPSGHKRYQVTITTDSFFGETNYVLKNTCTGAEVLKGCDCNTGHTSFSSAAVCAEAGEMEFVINDDYGDGLCCSYGNGGYVVTEDGIEVEGVSGGNFGYTETKTWGNCASTPTPPPIIPTTLPTLPPTNSPTTLPPTAPKYVCSVTDDLVITVTHNPIAGVEANE